MKARTFALSERKGQLPLMTLHQPYAGALLRHAVRRLGPQEPEDLDTAKGSGTSQNLLSFVATWYTDVVARDVHNLGTSIAPSK